MVTRAALHEEIDNLPDGVLETVSRAFERLRADRSRFMLDNAPVDDEPESEAEREGVALAKGQIAAGLGIPHEEVVRLLEAMR